MTTTSEQWFKTMCKKLGVETDEEVRQYMALAGGKASHPGTGGFAYMRKHDPERLKKISSVGGRRSKRVPK